MIITVNTVNTKLKPWDELRGYETNKLKSANGREIGRLKSAIVNRGFNFPFFLWADHRYIIDGAGRVEALTELEAEGWEIPPLPIVSVKAATMGEAKALALQASSQHGEITRESFLEFTEDIDLEPIINEITFDNFLIDEPANPYKDKEEQKARAGNLKNAYVYPPFSVLDRRAGYWQERRREWVEHGVGGLDGRKDGLLGFSGTMNITEARTSIFDPYLAEILYRWLLPPGGVILDPFAGGAVRGLVAATLGYYYFGVDLRPEQVEANRKAAQEVLSEGDKAPQWEEGDSSVRVAEMDFPDGVDLVFSCPPYADLEKYSDDPRDLSNMDYDGFLRVYQKIIFDCAAKLKQDRFACFVVGEVRGKDGNYYGFVPDTIRLFRAAGLKFYNEIVLIDPLGSLAMRAGKQFKVSRKIGKAHQNVLVFVKGDPKRAAEALGPVILPEVGEAATAEDVINDALSG